MAVYLASDLHGANDIWKLKHAPELLEPGDFLIVCGDFGLVCTDEELAAAADDPASSLRVYWYRWLAGQSWTALFIDGNPENYPLLAALPEEHWHGGRVHWIAPNICHLMRGEVFDLDGASVFTMGGASSHDVSCRLEGVSWWPEELPSYAEIDDAQTTLEGLGWRVDYVVTHTQPQRVAAEALWPKAPYPEDRLMSWLAYVDDRIECKRWYSGHIHVDANVGERHTVICDRIVRLGEPV